MAIYKKAFRKAFDLLEDNLEYQDFDEIVSRTKDFKTELEKDLGLAVIAELERRYRGGKE